jgi:hypothetical protein
VLPALFRPKGLWPAAPHRVAATADITPLAAPMVSTATTLAPAAGTLLRVAGVSKRFGGVTALADVDLEVHPGEIVSLIGPNGACRVALWMENSAGTERYCHYYGPTHAERSSHHAFVRSSHRWHAEKCQSAIRLAHRQKPASPSICRQAPPAILGALRASRGSEVRHFDLVLR